MNTSNKLVWWMPRVTKKEAPEIKNDNGRLLGLVGIYKEARMPPPLNCMANAPVKIS